MTAAFLGLGSNLGDRRANLEAAIESLDWGSVSVVARSGVYETDPVGGPPDSPPYLNMVIEARTSLVVEDLFERCQAVEIALGRARANEERWGPRTIDVDLLLFGTEVVETAELTVPHPRMRERAFVLAPLVEIAPEIEIPGAGRARDLLAALNARGVRALT